MDGIFNPFFDPLGIKNYQMKRDEDRELGALSDYLAGRVQPQPDTEGFKRDQQAVLGGSCKKLDHGQSDAQLAAQYKRNLTHALLRRHIAPSAVPQGAWPDAPKLRRMCGR
jgi:hypothetical protein